MQLVAMDTEDIIQLRLETADCQMLNALNTVLILLEALSSFFRSGERLFELLGAAPLERERAKNIVRGAP